MFLMNLLVDWTLDKKKLMKQRISQENPQIEKPRGQTKTNQNIQRPWSNYKKYINRHNGNTRSREKNRNI